MFRLLSDPRAFYAAKIISLFVALVLGLVLLSSRIAGVQAVATPKTEPQMFQLPVPAETARSMPDFDAFESVDERKQAFFTYISDYVEKQNRAIRDTREALLPLREVTRGGHSLSEQEVEFVHEVAERYRLDLSNYSEAALLEELVLRVDIIPTSLVLAQAANESGWGTSRFAREANNLFGEWCFSEGCGLVPNQRASHASHEVRSFHSVEDSVQAYFRNINTNDAYHYLREMRADMRKHEGEINSLVLAHGLTRYSQRGHAYVSELQTIIRANGLYNRDRMEQGLADQS